MTIKKNYDDIIDYEYKGSTTRAKMPLSSRAKIFMPFAALRGFDDVIDDRQTLREPRRILSEDERETLDEQIRKIADLLVEGSQPMVTLRLFIPDSTRSAEWGAYRDVTGHAEKMRPVEREIRIDGRWYSLDMTDGISIL